MGEFDLDPQVEGAAGFGWEAHFRTAAQQAGGIMMAASTDCVYPCDPTGHPTLYNCPTCANTCGGTGRPCFC
ncbi:MULTISPECIES: hypothetical protein [Actinomadura]|uniref:Uncharacterized protein n=1 Tax=Actinomadura miaoliensis TaxID=430685 RepID=A0ABP7WSQ6_9ACTN